MMTKIAASIIGAIRGALVAALIVFNVSLPAEAQLTPPSNVVASVSGTNTITGTLPNVLTYAQILNVPLTIVPANNNTAGAATLNLNSFGTSPSLAVPSSSGLSTTLAANTLVAGVPASVMYNGTDFVILTSNTATLPSLLPQGYLTPCELSAGSPVTGCTAGQLIPTGDVTAATAVYYEPAFGNGISIYNGTQMVNYTFTELTLTLPSSFASGTIRDVCIFNNAGTPTIVGSVAWTTSTAGSGNRGSGASTAQIALLDGIETNAVQINGVNGATTYSNIPANECTMVGTLRFEANGAITWNVAYGQSRQIGVANFYNLQPVFIKAGDSTTSWNDANTSGFGSANGSTNNAITVLFSLPAKLVGEYLQQDSVSTGEEEIGIGYNVTNAASGTLGFQQNTLPTGGGVSNNGPVLTTLNGKFTTNATIGAQTLTAITYAVSGTNTLKGTEAYMALTADYRN